MEMPPDTLETVGINELFVVVGVEAKWHVRVSEQSCKQANRLILWGVGGAPPKKNLDFFYFFFLQKNLKNTI